MSQLTPEDFKNCEKNIDLSYKRNSEHKLNNLRQSAFWVFGEKFQAKLKPKMALRVLALDWSEPCSLCQVFALCRACMCPHSTFKGRSSLWTSFPLQRVAFDLHLCPLALGPLPLGLPLLYWEWQPVHHWVQVSPLFIQVLHHSACASACPGSVSSASCLGLAAFQATEGNRGRCLLIQSVLSSSTLSWADTSHNFRASQQCCQRFFLFQNQKEN